MFSSIDLFPRHNFLLQGSITGAYSSISDKVTPSFILLAVQGSKVVCYVYELMDGEVDVSKTEFTKTIAGDGEVLFQ